MAMNQISCWQEHEEDFAKNADVISKSADDNIGYQPVWYIRRQSLLHSYYSGKEGLSPFFPTITLPLFKKDRLFECMCTEVVPTHKIPDNKR